MMEEKIEQYLRDERGVASDVVRRRLREKVMKYDDIAEEFGRWLEKREYESGVEVEGHTAQGIYELAPRLDGIGVFNFLVTLRDDPEGAKEMIQEGFVVR